MLFLINLVVAYCSDINLTPTITSSGTSLFISLTPQESATYLDAIITYSSYFQCIQAQVQITLSVGSSDSLTIDCSNNIITITNIQSSKPYSLTINYFKTPFYNVTLDTTMKIYDHSNNNLLSTLSKSITAPVLTGCGNVTLIPSSAIAFDQTTLTLSFIPCIPFDVNSYIQIAFPSMNSIQASNPIDFFSSPICLPLTCSYNNKILKISNLALLSDLTQLNLQILGYRNKYIPQIIQTQLYVMYDYSGTTYYTEQESVQIIISAFPRDKSFQIQPSDNIIQKASDMKFTISVPSYINSNLVINMTMQYISTLSPTVVCIQNCVSGTVVQYNYILSVNLVTTPFINNNLIFTITGTQNPIVPQTLQADIVLLEPQGSSNYVLQQGTASYTIEQDTIQNIQVLYSNVTFGINNIVTIKFTIPQYVQDQSLFYITYPSQFNCIQTGQIGQVKYDCVNSQVVISNLFNQTSLAYEVQLTNFINPYQQFTQQQYNLQIMTLNQVIMFGQTTLTQQLIIQQLNPVIVINQPDNNLLTQIDISLDQLYIASEQSQIKIQSIINSQSNNLDSISCSVNQHLTTCTLHNLVIYLTGSDGGKAISITGLSYPLFQNTIQSIQISNYYNNLLIRQSNLIPFTSSQFQLQDLISSINCTSNCQVNSQSNWDISYQSIVNINIGSYIQVQTTNLLIGSNTNISPTTSNITGNNQFTIQNNQNINKNTPQKISLQNILINGDILVVYLTIIDPIYNTIQYSRATSQLQQQNTQSSSDIQFTVSFSSSIFYEYGSLTLDLKVNLDITGYALLNIGQVYDVSQISCRQFSCFQHTIDSQNLLKIDTNTIKAGSNQLIINNVRNPEYQNNSIITYMSIQSFDSNDLPLESGTMRYVNNLTCSSNCSQCTRLGCIQCFNSFYLVESKCIQNCPNLWYLDKNRNNCFQCKVQDSCLSCSDISTCSKCADGYTLVGVQCYKNNIIMEQPAQNNSTNTTQQFIQNSNDQQSVDGQFYLTYIAIIIGILIFIRKRLRTQTQYFKSYCGILSIMYPIFEKLVLLFFLINSDMNNFYMFGMVCFMSIVQMVFSQYMLHQIFEYQLELKKKRKHLLFNILYKLGQLYNWQILYLLQSDIMDILNIHIDNYQQFKSRRNQITRIKCYVHQPICLAVLLYCVTEHLLNNFQFDFMLFQIITWILDNIVVYQDYKESQDLDRYQSVKINQVLPLE